MHMRQYAAQHVGELIITAFVFSVIAFSNLSMSIWNVFSSDVTATNFAPVLY